jgi:hypothetical protein
MTVHGGSPSIPIPEYRRKVPYKSIRFFTPEPEFETGSKGHGSLMARATATEPESLLQGLPHLFERWQLCQKRQDQWNNIGSSRCPSEGGALSQIG